MRFVKYYTWPVVVAALSILVSAVSLYGIRQSRSLRTKALIPFIPPQILSAVEAPSYFANLLKEATPTTIPSSTTPTPASKPLTLAEMNELYGPCTRLPVLMYHHVHDLDRAKEEGHPAYLTVGNNTFRRQMQYLKEKAYTPVSARQTIDFFDEGGRLPNKPILITFDDGYDDFAAEAYPVLKEYGFPAIVFTITGFVDMPSYVTWREIVAITSETDLILFANHTGSHSLSGSYETVYQQIVGADQNLAKHGQNEPKVFAYPYGTLTGTAKKILAEQNYQLAFTTNSGMIQCAKQRLQLPRLRIGNAQLDQYGL